MRIIVLSLFIVVCCCNASKKSKSKTVTRMEALSNSRVSMSVKDSSFKFYMNELSIVIDDLLIDSIKTAVDGTTTVYGYKSFKKSSVDAKKEIETFCKSVDSVSEDTSVYKSFESIETKEKQSLSLNWIIAIFIGAALLIFSKKIIKFFFST